MYQLFNDTAQELLSNLEDNSVDLVLTDIPYGEVNAKAGVSGIRDLNKGDADVVTFDLGHIADEIARVTSGSCYIFCGTKQISEIVRRLEASKMSTRVGVWEKSNPSPMNGKRLWLSGAEFCVFGRKANATFNEHCKSAIWRNPVGRAKEHPTQKPVELMRRLVLASSNPGDLVVDPFCGSGSTGVAAIEEGRRFVGTDINPEYVALSKRRLDEAGRTFNGKASRTDP